MPHFRSGRSSSLSAIKCKRIVSLMSRVRDSSNSLVWLIWEYTAIFRGIGNIFGVS